MPVSVLHFDLFFVRHSQVSVSAIVRKTNVLSLDQTPMADAA
mgnify:CR=1 FL=1